MKLNATEKRVLTLLDNVHLEKFPTHATTLINISAKNIQAISKRLISLGFIRIEQFNKEPWAFHTEKVTAELLDKNLAITVQTLPKIHLTD